ncbi:MAG: hypothetical protein EPN47_09980 [Acidobacteria bacterium]|nr:MAG: hypothetical protein EPN47_09980 [Acidobacteriota bacterium]
MILDFNQPGRPTDNADVESFNGGLRAECLSMNWRLPREVVRGKIDAWGNTIRVVLTLR